MYSPGISRMRSFTLLGLRSHTCDTAPWLKENMDPEEIVLGLLIFASPGVGMVRSVDDDPIMETP